MHIPLAIVVVSFSACAVALFNETVNASSSKAETPSTRNGLPFDNFDPSNGTLRYPTHPSENPTMNGSDHHHRNVTHISEKLATNGSDHHDHHHNYTENTNSSTPSLFARGSAFGDIACYSGNPCTTNVTAKLILNSKCQTFKAQADTCTYIGINWGSGAGVRMQSLTAYTDADCNDFGYKTKTPGHSINMMTEGAGTCVAYNYYLQSSAPWLSVCGY